VRFGALGGSSQIGICNFDLGPARNFVDNSISLACCTKALTDQNQLEYLVIFVLERDLSKTLFSYFFEQKNVVLSHSILSES
jgi:hypothetical protein